MLNLLEYEYVHIDSDFILIEFTILHTSVIYKIATYTYLTVYMTQLTVNFD